MLSYIYILCIVTGESGNIGTLKMCSQNCADSLRPMASACKDWLAANGLSMVNNDFRRILQLCPPPPPPPPDPCDTLEEFTSYNTKMGAVCCKDSNCELIRVYPLPMMPRLLFTMPAVRHSGCLWCWPVYSLTCCHDDDVRARVHCLCINIYIYICVLL